MKPELDKQLCEKYPKIFKNRNASQMESCMYWGIDVSDGWYDIIDALCQAATYTYTTSPFSPVTSQVRSDSVSAK